MVLHGSLPSCPVMSLPGGLSTHGEKRREGTEGPGTQPAQSQCVAREWESPHGHTLGSDTGTDVHAYQLLSHFHVKAMCSSRKTPNIQCIETQP